MRQYIESVNDHSSSTIHGELSIPAFSRLVVTADGQPRFRESAAKLASLSVLIDRACKRMTWITLCKATGRLEDLDNVVSRLYTRTLVYIMCLLEQISVIEP